jgi:uncharacterized membrane protein YjjP (DUF1212 family)
MVKTSVNRYIVRRIEKAIEDVDSISQKLRQRTLRNLEEIFRVASRIARGQIKHQRINRKMVRINLKQRRRWLSVATFAAQAIKTVASNINEKEIRTQFKELERLVDEAGLRAEDE